MLFSMCRSVKLLQKKKTHSVLRKVCCGVTGETLCRHCESWREERSRRFSPSTFLSHGSRMPCRATCHSPPSQRLTHACRTKGITALYPTHAPFETCNVWNGGNANWPSRWKCAWTCTHAHKKLQMASNFGHTNTPQWVIASLTAK